MARAITAGGFDPDVEDTSAGEGFARPDGESAVAQAEQPAPETRRPPGSSGLSGYGTHRGASPRITIRAAVTARGAKYDVEIPGGELTAIMGPNGAGKSTMLELVAGSLQPDSGRISFDPADVTVTILQQKPLLFPHMSVQANVEFGLRCRGVGKPEARRRATSELAQVRCEALAERRPHQLSGGQAQRVAIARAMAINPDVVLLDEPMAGLDEESACQVRAQLRERLAGSGVTALLVTHDPVDAEELASRTVLIRHGRVERVTAR
ncbi:ATP-binding cassette domain-containing protein [Actinobaculum sp. 313]|nr:ATP-binding cassette domain-containing protein [Actinobaculum sp. 313]